MLVEKVSLGGEVAEFAETFVRHTRGELAGQTIELRPFQKEILNGLFELDEKGLWKPFVKGMMYANFMGFN